MNYFEKVTETGVLLQIVGYEAVEIPVITAGTPQQVVDSVDVNITSGISLISTTGAAAGAIADGIVVGQIKEIVMVIDGGNYVLTPANFTSGATITFDDVNDTVKLLWDGSGWQFISGTATVA